VEDSGIYNGIDATTGRYLSSPGDRDFADRLAGPPLTPSQLREYRWWVERYGIDDPERSPVRDIDANDLASAGWAVVFGPNVTPEEEAALQPLLKLRQEQAGPLYKPLRYREKSKAEFLARQGAGPGPANPRKLPYYLLLVGDPETLPFRAQYELDVQYAVGRIYFKTPAEYGSYAKGVVDYETKREIRRPKRLSFFGVSNADDRATFRTSRELIEPLADSMEKSRGWSVERILRDDAVKPRLQRLLGGAETPSLLFSATHGVAFPVGHERQLSDQGGLLCQEWPGPKAGMGPILPHQYFTGADLADDADVRGLITVSFACYSAGTPDVDDFAEPNGDKLPQRIAERPFVSQLAQRLLGHPGGGALAVLGHVDRAWTSSFSWTEEGQIEVFESTLKTILDGCPIGAATEYINQRYAELSTEVSGLWNDWQYDQNPDPDLFSRMWRANQDARNFVVLGDPAVRLHRA
jgi:hypothetical protein